MVIHVIRIITMQHVHYTSNHIKTATTIYVFYDYYKWFYMLVMVIMLSLNLVKVTGWIVGYAYPCG